MRWNHLLAGLTLFGVGLFLAYLNSPLVVQCIKGAVQPAALLLGSLAGLSVLFRRTRLIKTNTVAAIVLLFIGCYGVYDEYLATKDFFLGAGPLALAGFGLVAIGHGLRRQALEQSE